VTRVSVARGGGAKRNDRNTRPASPPKPRRKEKRREKKKEPRKGTTKRNAKRNPLSVLDFPSVFSIDRREERRERNHEKEREEKPPQRVGFSVRF
jgi:hypothetical protein